MRVVHVITRFLNAGAEENTIISCNGQIDKGYDVWLIHGREVSSRALGKLHSGVQVLQAPNLIRAVHPWKDLLALLSLRKCFQELRPDIVHTHTSKAGILGRFAARLARVPYIIHGVHILPFLNVSTINRIVYLFLERWAAKYTDSFINVSDGMKEENLKAGVGRESQHFVVPSGMDTARFVSAVPADGWYDDGRKKPFTLIFVGAFEERKRHLAFLDIFKKLLSDLSGLHLLFLGEGALETAIRAKIVELQLEKHVTMLGFRDDVERYIAAADVGVLPSEREGLARVIMQYLLCGKPVVVTSNPGVEAIVKHGRNGFLAPVESPEQMQEYLADLIKNQELYKQLSEGARNTNLSAWDGKNMVNEIEKIYQSLQISA